jgi:C1A family cysteine protease
MFANLIVLASIISATFAANLRDRSYYEERFFNWMATQSLKPENGERFTAWLQNFANNDDIIEQHNGGNSTFTLGHNQFSHLSLDEWRVYVGLNLPRPQEVEAPISIHEAPADVSALATKVDWVASGAVTGVKDQGQCGSCWSFSTTGAVEGAHKIKYGSLTSYSEQNLVDCDTRSNGGSDMGCNGGWMDSAFSWMKKNGGICTEAAYPYTSGTTKKAGTCNQSKCTKDSKSAPVSYTDVTKNSDSALASALNKGPVSVAIEADQSSFQLYKSGVYTATCGATLDHGVLAVGYDDASWKVKNSWGTGWGSGGYIYLARGNYNNGAGQCGILSGPPSYPNL